MEPPKLKGPGTQAYACHVNVIVPRMDNGGHAQNMRRECHFCGHLTTRLDMYRFHMNYVYLLAYSDVYLPPIHES